MHNKLLNRSLSFLLACSLALSLAISSNSYFFVSHAYEKSYYSWDEVMQDASTSIMYILCQMGAIGTSDLSTYIQNQEVWNEYWNADAVENGYVTIEQDEDTGEVTNITYSAELIQAIKDLLDEYAEENEGYYIGYTINYDNLEPSMFSNSYDYLTTRALIRNSDSEMCAVRINGAVVTVWCFDDYYNNDYSLVSHGYVESKNYCYGRFYDNYLWTSSLDVYGFTFYNLTSSYSSFDDLLEGYENGDENITSYHCTDNSNNSYYVALTLDGSAPTTNQLKNYAFIYSKGSSVPVRVYKTLTDLQNASVGNRTVYYTSNYYTYEATDTTSSLSDIVAIAEAVADILSSLTDMLTGFESENYIMELLTTLLEQLITSSTDSSGNTTTTYNNTIIYESPVTTSWLNSVTSYLQKILAQITESNTLLGDVVELLTPDETETETEAETETETETETESEDNDSGGGWLDTITGYLEDILSQLKSIKNWTVADTVADVADAVADWASFIADFFADVGAGVATVASGFSGLADTLSGKFPFSIPWDLAFLVGLLAADPEAPVFELPIYIPSYGIDVTYSVDFSQFAVLSQISRCLLTITFIFGLLKFTEKVINVKEDG